MSASLEALHRAVRWLPHQGPLPEFIHTNTLGSFEDRDFHEALDAAEGVFGARVRLLESELRAMLADGRIAPLDLRAVFDAENSLGEVPMAEGLPSERILAWRVLWHGFPEQHWRIRSFLVAESQPDPSASALEPPVRAVLAEGARRLFTRDAQAAVEVLVGTQDPDLARSRLRQQLGVEGAAEARQRCLEEGRTAVELGIALLAGLARRGLPDLARHEPPPLDRAALERRADEILTPLVAAALDLGTLAWRPAGDLFELGRKAIVRSSAGALAPLLGTAEETLERSLAILAPAGEEHWEAALLRTLAPRAGWAGAVHWREAHVGAPRLVEYAALRLALLVALAREQGLSPEILVAPPSPVVAGLGARASQVALLLAMNAIPADRVLDLPPAAWGALEELGHRVGAPWRTRLLQEARERTARGVWLHALARAPSVPSSVTPELQVLCCIDEREESFRRAIEAEGGAAVETLGLAGHFSLLIQWKGREDVHASSRHPVVLASTHRVGERSLAAPSRLRRLLGRAARWVDRGGSTSLQGAVALALLGLPALLAGWFRVLWPWQYHERVEQLARRLLPPPPAELVALRDPGEEPGDGLPLGLSVEEAAEVVGGTLRLVGLCQGLAPWVVVMGHGSTSRNNPHESAHECGACGGHKGDANGRVFAVLANDVRVRSVLAGQGLRISEQTRFVGALHDTASDAVTFAPEEELPAAWNACLQRAAARDAQERGRRFWLLDGSSGPRVALEHVRRRSADLSQVRPEYGHATNAILVVGPRSRTRSLFLDRRAFLHSYEPDHDPDGALLARLLGAAVPVCSGINLEYYFSRVDNERFGAGTKIPHNVTGLHGVMNGSLGDLRTGLPWQMVEIHEPTRLVVVVFAPRVRLAAVMERLPVVDRLVRGRWIHLAAIDEAGTAAWEDGSFRPVPLGQDSLPGVPSAEAWFAGRRDALSPARLEAP